jgi:GNAT superfamily N-acetyltransferase
VDASVESDVVISEVDPLDPVNEPVLHAMWDVSAAARADRPFEVWAPWTTAYATWTTVRDDQDDVMWAATADGVVVGMAWLVMSHVDNQHVATTELFVHPDHRRRASGRRCCRRSWTAARAAGARC